MAVGYAQVLGGSRMLFSVKSMVLGQQKEGGQAVGQRKGLVAGSGNNVSLIFRSQEKADIPEKDRVV